MESLSNISGIRVKIKRDKNSNFPTPFGLNYCAKGFYVQGKFAIIVGNLSDNSTIRMKYPIDNVSIELIYNQEIYKQ
jgi:hypothetical protein